MLFLIILSFLGGQGCLKTATPSTRLTMGVHWFSAVYMGMFIQCSAERLAVVYTTKNRDASRYSLPVKGN